MFAMVRKLLKSSSCSEYVRCPNMGHERTHNIGNVTTSVLLNCEIMTPSTLSKTPRMVAQRNLCQCTSEGR